MTTYVPRTVREIKAGRSQDQLESEPLPIEDFRSRDAYVLLGPPGAGKTTAFRQEAGSRQGMYVTAREFNTFDDSPEWHDTTLFIDGLDETRAGQADGRTPFDRIRARLDKLGCPRFRLSCREADWFGATDSERLKAVSPDCNITVLRIDPLSDEDIHRILHDNLGIPDAGQFIAEARGKGVQGLLTNPKSLEMLALAVRKGGDWPETKNKAFEMACKTLVREHNAEHEVATRDSYGVPELMNASGRLSAVLLLTGSAGFQLPGTESSNSLIAPEQLPGHDRDLYLRCLQSKLFESPAPDPAIPVHRQVAEFLAGRYLAGLVDDGLPVGRILALVTGHDGVVVSELRGLIAWLAAKGKAGRSEIIRRDPVGTILYGDVSDFSPEEKRLLLDRLMVEVKENYRSIPQNDLSSRLGDLMTPDMVDIVREILEHPSREEPSQVFAIIILKALDHAVPLPGLDGTLMRIIRDETRWPHARLKTLEALMRYREPDYGHSGEFKTLADDISVGKVRDRSDTLLVYLLAKLYPEVISESEILKYLKIPTRWKYDLDHESFWTLHLPVKSTPEQLTELLDQLAERSGQLLDNGTDHNSITFLRNIATALLARLLELAGEEIDLDRLYLWLNPVTTDDDDLDYYDGQFNPTIRLWLENHPSTWKSLLLMSIGHCADLPGSAESGGFSFCMDREQRHRLFSAAHPTDFGLWCLDLAISEEDERAVDWLLEQVAECLHDRRNNEGLSHNIVLEHLAALPGLREKYDKARDNIQSRRGYGNRTTRKVKSRPQAKHPDWHDHVKPSQAELRENRASPNLLYQLAKVYLGGFTNVQGRTPRERLGILLREDDRLVGDILTGFSRTIERDDLPTYREILRLGIRNHIHYLAYPIMAGLEDVSDPKRLEKIFAEERIIRLALVIHYSVPMWPTMRHPAGRLPSWFKWLLAERPGVVAEVLVEFALTRLRNRKNVSALFDLANTEGHAEVARLATMPLLEKFPVRCTSDQLSNLNYLLLSAGKYCRRKSLLSLIDKKLARGGMNIAQRIHWLTAGLYISPETYAQELQSYVTGKERRIRFLAEAVTGRLQLPSSMQHGQGVTTLQLLISLLGTSYRPYSFDEDSEKGGWYSPEMGTADRIRGYIEQLGTISSSSATDAIRNLLAENHLRPWRSDLLDAAYRQNAVRREAEFRYCDIHQVLETLDRKKPANAADLAALTSEKLKEMMDDIRRGNSSGWRRFWNVDEHNRPQRPKPEDACRDSLVWDLRAKLESYDIDVQPEPHYANDKRADIRVAYRNSNVPVEIKRSCHRDLWSAIRTQLISKYAIDPGTGGYGIYLVFWFGNTEHCNPTPPPSGTIPTGPAELEERLKLSLSSREKNKIQVCVIDVAKPN